MSTSAGERAGPSLCQADWLGPAAEQLYSQLPQRVALRDGAHLFAEAMGATLYIPGQRPDLLSDLDRVRRQGVTSVVLDLEDSVPEADAASAGERVRDLLLAGAARAETAFDTVAVFVRLRQVQHLPAFLAETAQAARLLTGIVLPKTGPEHVDEAASALDGIGDDGRHLVLMPILESQEFIHPARRVTELVRMRSTLEAHRARVLMVRVGGTDLAGLYALRRSPDVVAHDVHIIASALGDIVGVLGGPEGFRVSGLVWEHLIRTPRILRPQLRMSPFQNDSPDALAATVRDELMRDHLDGLVREIVLDRANGLTGKTVIHPDQALVVRAVSIVTAEEHADALDVLALGGGARRSAQGRRMNEGGPHRLWALDTVARAQACGVLRPGRTFADALAVFFRHAHDPAGHVA